MPCSHNNLDASCKHCKKLLKEWNQKLAKSGIPAIENERGELLDYHATKFVRKKHLEQNGGPEIKAEYYRLAGQFYHEYVFATDRDKKTWELHADGLTKVDILEAMETQGYKVSTLIIRETINRLETLMKNRLWIT